MKAISRFLPAVLILALMAALFAAPPARAQSLTTIYSFKGSPDGAGPYTGNLYRDAQGNLYGATEFEGDAGCSPLFYCGAVFKIDPSGEETILHSFAGGADGAFPAGGVTGDVDGNLYGATVYSATNNGLVYKLDSSGNETVLYNFCSQPDCADGSQPYGTLLRDAQGNLYGTTEGGGANNSGTVFKLDASGNETVLHSFTGGADGMYPYAGVIRDAGGSLYGATLFGGGSTACDDGCGTVYKIDPSGNETILYTFSGGEDGSWAYAPVIRDSQGNIYGATAEGGTRGTGVVFKLDPSGRETVLHSFQDTLEDGAEPVAGLIRDDQGNLYGTTYLGGYGHCYCGVIFKVTPAGKEVVLHKFINAHGDFPLSGLIGDGKGNLYGTTHRGGDGNCKLLEMYSGCGTVYKLSP